MKAKQLCLFLFATILSLVCFTPDVNAARTVIIDHMIYWLYENSMTAEVAGLTGITIGESVDVTIPSYIVFEDETYNVTKIREKAFKDVKYIKSVEIANGITSIEADAFYKSSLQQINIPVSVISIGSYAFMGTDLYNKSKNWENGVLYIDQCMIAVEDVKELSVKYGTRLIADNACDMYEHGEYKILEQLTLPNTVKYIGNNAFKRCEKLKTVQMSNTIKEIGDYAFYYCPIEEIELPNTLENIGTYAFSKTNLKEVTYPIATRFGTINEGVFAQCKELTKVVLSTSISRIDKNAFAGCTALRHFYCLGKTRYSESAFEDVKLNRITLHFKDRYVQFYQQNWKGFDLNPERFSMDGIYYGLNDAKRTGIVVQETSGSDNYSALIGAITIPNSVTDVVETFTINGIGIGVFSYSPISRITFEAPITRVSEDAFAHCANLTDAVLPNSVTEIEENAFGSCSKLENVPGLTNDQTAFLPKLDKIGAFAFADCIKLPKLRLHNASEIGEKVFINCTSVTDIILGASVSKIGKAAFAGCTKLEKVTILADKPQAFPDNLFDGIDKSQFVIYVHRTAYAAFKAADGWKDYNIQIIPEEVQCYSVYLEVNNSAAGTVSGGGTYVAGTEVTVTATPKDGYHFVRWSDGETKASYSFKLTKDVSLQAVFEADVITYYYDLNLQSNDETMGTVSGGGKHIEKWIVVDITATPKEGYEFMYWIDSNGVNRGRISSWMVTDDITFTAYFREKSTTKNYSLWLCGQQVTSANCIDILGDGVWAYDHESRTLMTMKDATYNLTDTEFLTDMVSTGGLTVVFNHRVDVTINQTGSTGRQAIYNNKPLTFTGSAFKGLILNVQNMYVGNFKDVLKITGHIDVSFYHKNTTEWGKSNVKKAFYLSSKTPALVVDGAALDVMAGIGETTGYTVSDKTDQDTYLLLNNAVVDDGSISAKYLYISDSSPKYKLDFATPELESICAVGGFNSYFEGTHVTLRAWPVTSYEFVRWSDGTTDNPYTFIMPAHDVLIDPVVIGEEIDPDGAIVYAEGQWLRGYVVNENDESVYNGEWFPNGTKITLKAVGKNGFVFAKWSDGNTDNPRYITIEAGKHIDLQAEFVYPEYFTVTFLDWDNEVLKEEKVFVGEDAQEPEQPYRQGYTFTGWDKDFTNVTADLVVKAQFEINTFTVRFFDMEGVQIGADQQIEYGKAATAPDAPEVEGYVFVAWDKFLDYIESDLDVYALYELERFKVELIVGEHGSVVADIEDLDAVPSGETIMLVALPEEYYEVENWSIDGEGDTRTLVVTSDTTVSVTFVKKQFEVTFIGFEGAVIDVVKVPAGEAATAPEPPIVEGYHFVEWDTPFNEIWENTTVTAIYEADAVNQPQNLKVVLTEIDGDTKIDFSWDVLEGAAGYAVGLGYGEQAQTLSAPTNSLSFLFSAIVAKYQIQPGTYTIRWFVAGVDADGNPIGDWAEGEPFEVTVKKNEQGIEDTRVEDGQPQKVLLNGVLYILRDGNIYTIQGAEVK